MDELFSEIQVLLAEVSEQLKSPVKAERAAAVKKLHRIAALATTLAFTLDARR